MSSEIISTEIAGFPALRVCGGPNRPTLMFIHGAFTTHEPWRAWMVRLAEHGWPSVATALRGRLGVAPNRAKGLRFADYLHDTMRVIDELGQAPIIVGHSLGGLIAQKVAEAGRCQAMVLLAPAPAAMLTAQPVALPAYLPMVPKILTGRPVLPSKSGCARIALNRMPVDQQPECHASLVHESGIVYRELMFGAVTVDAKRITCPTYVLGGTQDRIVSQSLLRFTAQRYQAKLQVLEGHAHWLLEEPGWEAIADDVATWLHDELLGLQRQQRGTVLPLTNLGQSA